MQLRMLCNKFCMPFGDVKTFFKKYKETGERMISKFRQLQNSINTLPMSTAECEHGFSKMNIACDP